MKKKNLLIGRWLFALFSFIGLLLVACTEGAIDGENGCNLYYSGICEIAPSTNISITPTWRGGTPTNFTIGTIRFEEVPIETSCFSVDSQTGVFSIRGSDLMETGLYTVDILCEFNHRQYEFPAAIQIRMMKPVPDGIIVTPAEITATLSDIMLTIPDTTLPTACITTDGSDHVQINDYLISNVYRNGILVNECKTWFNVSSEGVFSIVPNNVDFEAGIYTFDFKLTTYIAGVNSEIGIFKNALKLKVTSAPTLLRYVPAGSCVELGISGQSATPSIKGSLEGLKYAIKSVAPDNTVGITIDENTGVLTYPETTDVTLNTTYTVSVTVSNDYGSTDFENAYSFTVIAFIKPITIFSYNDINESISGVSLSNPVSEIVGDEVTYSFVNLHEDLSPLEIDPQTGTVTCEKGIELPVGVHTVTVQAMNIKGSMQASFTINIIANPNHFTYVRWGNNLGADREALTPLEKYGNQFRVYQSEAKLVLPIVESDIPSGATVTFSHVRKTDNSSGFSLNTQTGRVEIYPKASGGPVYPHIHFISVTVGTGESAITHTFPFFIDQCGHQNGYQIEYTPFVFRVNPKTGGLSSAPIIKDSDGEIFTGGSIDYYTNICFYNLYGPSEHTNDKRLNQDNTGFLKTVWNKYYNAIGQPANYGVRNPMTYWDNVDNNRLSYTGGYFRATDLRFVVNPEKFVDEYGYANGIMTMISKFNSDGVNPHTTATNTTQVTRLIVWFDPDYTE